MKAEKFIPEIILDHASLIPLRTQIVSAFRREIVRLRLSAGMKIVSERQLTETLGINRNTVHQAYEQLTQEGFLADSPLRGGGKLISIQAAEHYRIPFPMLNLTLPYKLSEQLKCNNPQAMAIIAGIIDRATELGISVNFMALPDPELSPEDIREYFKRFLPHSIGYVTLGHRIKEFDPVFAELLACRTLPHVFVSGRSKLPHISSVSVDLEPGVRAMLEHLRNLGHRRLGVIAAFHGSNPQFINVAFDRGSFIRKLANEYEMETVSYELSPLTPEQDARGAVHAIFSSAMDHPTAIWIQNDASALNAVDELTRMGLQVPRDVSVIGYDNIAGIDKLATIDHPRIEIGRRSVDIIHKLFNHCVPGDALHETVPSRFIPNNGCAQASLNLKPR